MSLWFGAVGFLLAAGLGALLLWRQEKLIGWLVPAFMAGAAILGGISSLKVLLGGVAQIFHAPWSVPFGEFSLRIDSLTAWFLIPTLVLSALSAIYGAQYLEPFRGKNRLGAAWFFYSLLVIGMCFVLTAQNAVLFLFAWELMAVASFFLVTFEHGLDGVREAGWIYFVATHLGTAFLVVFFLTMSRETGSMDFSVWAERGVSGRGLTGLLFLLAIVGFGTKAGLMPFHIWLPEAHTAAPSHVSALMSGAMIKTGIYGMLRTLTFLGAPEDWWGWVLLGLGLMSAILGILFGLMQHDLKRLLAYSSIENMGLITSAIGLGLLAICYRHPLISALSFSAALLHVLNHSLFKGLLFLAAGSVAHATGTRRMDQLGGLLKRMPWTGFLFLFGAAAICGLPPLNGFLSELLLAGSSLVAMTNDSPALAVAGLLALGGLGLVGGLTAAAFTKAFGIVFLGQQRQPFRIEPHEAGLPMKFAMAVLALACIAVVVGAGFVLKGVAPIEGQISGIGTDEATAQLRIPAGVLITVSICAGVLVCGLAMLALARRGLLAGRDVGEAGTWDCGYARPTARMQYTASSFSQPIAAVFHWLLGTRYNLRRPVETFPNQSFLATETPDFSHGNLYHPAFLKVNWCLAKLRWVQQGKVQLYVLYITATLILLLIWKFR